MRIAHIASEVHPFAKTGGLADVAGTLPAAIAALGHHVTVVTPAHRSTPDMPVPGDVAGVVAAMGHQATVFRLERHGVEVLLLDCPDLFLRPAPYGTPAGDFPDNHRRFAFFCHAAIAVLAQRGGADILHAHDWQAALIPVLLHHEPEVKALLGEAATVLTIHNLAYQGIFPADLLEECGLPWSVNTVDVMEYWGKVSFLKGGLTSADALTTVSPTYAQEILTPSFGCGLEGVLQQRRTDLTGILNGLDGREWNPGRDPALPATYGPDDAATGKAAARAALTEETGLAPGRRPLAGMVSRLADQKGADIVADAVPGIIAQGYDLVVLGSGDRNIQDRLRVAVAAQPGRAVLSLGFNDRLARRIYAASDVFLMPSRFEPCGLGQLIAMRYGAIPVVSRTGGLADTVTDLGQPGGTGVFLDELSPAGLLNALARAKRFIADRPGLRTVLRRLMRRDFSWERSARAYLELYRSLRAS